MATPPRKQYVDCGPCYRCGHAFLDHRFDDGGPEPCAAPQCDCAYYWVKLPVLLDIERVSPANA